MAEHNDATSSKSTPRGCLTRFIMLLLLLVAVGLGVSIYFMSQPQDLSDIQGHSPANRPPLRQDINAMLRNSLESSYPVTLTEGEINRWLLDALRTQQGGLLADKVSLDGVWVRLEDGRAEVVLERRVLGKSFTTSMYLQIEQTESDTGSTTEIQFHGGPFHPYLPFPKCGGRFGRLPVPQGFLLLVMPAFKNLAAAFPEELRLGFKEMARVKIADERLTLDPRVPQLPVPGSP